MDLGRFRNLSLKQKLYSIATGVSIFLVIIGTFTFYFISRLSRYADLNQEVDAFTKEVIHLTRAEKDFLLKGRADINFYTSGEHLYLKTHQNYLEKSQELLQSLVVSPLLDEDVKDDLVKIGENFDLYRQNFDELVNMIKARGYQEKGNVGEMLSAGKDAYEKTLLVTSEPFYAEQLSELKLIEKSYLLQKNPKYKEDLERIIKQIKQHLAKQHGLTNLLTGLAATVEDSVSASTSFMGSTDNRKIEAEMVIKALDNYQKVFIQLIEMDTKIGLSFQDGLTGTVQSAMASVENDIDRIADDLDKQNEKQVRWSITILIVMLFFAVAFILISLMRMSMIITKPLQLFRNYILTLGKGELPNSFEFESTDELGEMAVALNELTDNLKNTKEFVVEVGKGNLESEVNVFNNQGDLGGSLVEMRAELRRIAQGRQEQEIESEKRNWSTLGIAKFNDILRQKSESIEDLAYEVVKELVKYLNAAQGGVFLLNDKNKEDVFLELSAAFAYDRRKFIKKRFEVGEGIAGRCAQELETIFLTEIPNGHFEITSGLGKSSPTCVLVVPLKLNDQLYGVLEIASYRALEPFQLEFTERVAETVASAIQSVKISTQTAKLLEETQMQARELASKEEEMRQNMEELQATQEAAARKEAEATGFVNSVNHTIIRADYDLNGHLLYVNSKFTDLMNYSTKEVMSKHYSMFVDDVDLESFEEEWARVTRGGKHIEREMRYKTKESFNWFLATYTPIKNREGDVEKILYLAIDIQDQKKKTLEFESEISTINRSLIKAEYQPDGSLVHVNDIFLSTLGYRKEEIDGRTLFTFLRERDLKKFEAAWKRILKGLPYEGQICKIGKKGRENWFQATFSAVRDFDGNIYKVIYVAYDITDQKHMQEEAKNNARDVKQREVELRETVDKMQQVQNEMAQKEAMMSGQFEALNKANALIEFDLEGTILTANDIFCELFGYIDSEIIGKNHRIFLEQEEKKADTVEQFWRRLKDGRFIEGEFKRVGKNGDDIYLKGVYNPIMGSDNKPTKVLMLALNITSSKKQEGEIRDQLNAIGKTNAMIEYDMEGNVLKANNMFCELFGYTESEILGRNQRIFLNEEDKGDWIKIFWNNLRTGVYQEGEIRGVRKDGGIVYLRAVSYPMLDTSGRPYKVLTLAIDLSELKEHERELNKQANELKQQEAVLQKALLDAKDKEERIQRQKEELATTEEELRQNLEELQATQEAMTKKQEEVEKVNEKLKSNESVLKRAMLKSKEQELEFKKALAEKEQLIAELRKQLGQ